MIRELCDLPPKCHVTAGGETREHKFHNRNDFSRRRTQTRTDNLLEGKKPSVYFCVGLANLIVYFFMFSMISRAMDSRSYSGCQFRCSRTAPSSGLLVKESATERLMQRIERVLNGEYYVDGSVSHRVVEKLVQTPDREMKITDAAHETLTSREQEIMVD